MAKEKGIDYALLLRERIQELRGIINAYNAIPSEKRTRSVERALKDVYDLYEVNQDYYKEVCGVRYESREQ